MMSALIRFGGQTPLASRVLAVGLATLGLAWGGSRGLSADDELERPIGVKAERVLEHLEIARPIVMTHAGDGSGRFFIASQLGQIYVLESSDSKEDPEMFLDLSDRVSYSDKQNEEGLLGLAFHPEFKENGRLYVYYTTNTEPHVSIVSSFLVDRADPSKADPQSEVEIMRVPQPFWNHNGGTIAFGPDGFMYIALGDGGGARDPMGNGQNLGNVFGAILRIDVDRTEAGKRYAIPEDNPFVKTEGAKPEIYAYGLRNPWRIAFDRETGLLWCADVGQDLWEEIDIIEKGGNYGWSVREGAHPFGDNGEEANAEKFIEPIFEYHHELGKSITGGNVYRGKQLPELIGVYLYGDYVSGRLWGLRYDAEAKKVTAVHPIDVADGPIAMITFGEDEAGETFFSDSAGRIYGFVRK